LLWEVPSGLGVLRRERLFLYRIIGDHGRINTEMSLEAWVRLEGIQVCWGMPIIPALGRLRQEALEFKANLEKNNQKKRLEVSQE
jgi:hypothetical protein